VPLPQLKCIAVVGSYILTTADRRRWEPLLVSVLDCEIRVHDAQGGDAAVSEIVAGIAALRGPKGLEDLVVDLARTPAST
jgi:hypothetical protein